MDKIAFDVSAFCGNWPFRMIHNNKIEDVLRVHRDNSIISGILSPMESVCYNDPYECDEQFFSVADKFGFVKAISINPTLPGFELDLEKAKQQGVKVVRVYPGVHKYDFTLPEFNELGKLCGQLGFVLQVFSRMDDVRLTYLLNPTAPAVDVTQKFIAEFDSCKVLWSNIIGGEITRYAKFINDNPNFFVDTSGLKDSLFVIEKMTDILNHKKMLYGSLFPLWCLKSTMLHIERSKVSDEIKNDILYNNAKDLLGL